VHAAKLKSKPLPSQLVLRLFLVALSVLFSFSATAAAQSSAPAKRRLITRSSDLPTFQTELHGIQNKLLQAASNPNGIAEVEATLPQSWIVVTSEGEYRISGEPLRELLEDAKKQPAQRSERIRQAQEWVGESTEEVDGYASLNARRDANAHDKLDQILSRREFNNVYSQSAWEQFRQRALDWIGRMITRLFERMGNHPIAARALFWLMLLGGVTALALLLFRTWAKRARGVELKVKPEFVSTQSWQEWIHDARLAADAGSFREAIHSLYWAGIVYLEAYRVIPCERSRTPRERLRGLPASTPNASGDPENRRELLQALTSRLERTWYANLPTTRQDYLEYMQLVEELGCKWH
jgi:hypothetical protein